MTSKRFGSTATLAMIFFALLLLCATCMAAAIPDAVVKDLAAASDYDDRTATSAVNPATSYNEVRECKFPPSKSALFHVPMMLTSRDDLRDGTKSLVKRMVDVQILDKDGKAAAVDDLDSALAPTEDDAVPPASISKRNRASDNYDPVDRPLIERMAEVMVQEDRGSSNLSEREVGFDEVSQYLRLPWWNWSSSIRIVLRYADLWIPGGAVLFWRSVPWRKLERFHRRHPQVL